MCIMKNVEIILKKGGKGKKNGLVERTGGQEKERRRRWLERIMSDC